MRSLAVAKALAAIKFEYTLRFVGFDEEEKGLVGSRSCVKRLNQTERERIIADVNFALMGTNSRKDGGFHVIDCDQSDSKWINEKNYECGGFIEVCFEASPGLHG